MHDFGIGGIVRNNTNATEGNGGAENVNALTMGGGYM